MKKRVDWLPGRRVGYNRKGALRLDRFSLDKLASDFGTPVYAYSLKQIVERFRLFENAFRAHRPLICYAVKANSNLSILRLLAREGAGFDIVSGGELERVLAAEPKAVRQVVFSGVGKTADELDLGLKKRILHFNVESEGELDLLAERAAKLRRVARFALRVNPDVFAETHPYISTGLREHKFGIDIRDARALYQRAGKSRWLEPAGISVHIGSQIRTAEPFGAAVARVAELVRTLRGEGIAIRSIDAGGGLGIEYLLDQDFDPAQAVEEYARTIEAALGDLDVDLLLEPGRFLVATAGVLMTRVLYVKKNGEKTFVVTDAGMNDLIRPTLYQAHHAILPVLRRPDAPVMVADVVGPVCETGDFFARDREIPAVQAGELLAILDAGAYGMSLASNYNTRPRAAEVLVDGRHARLIRRREKVHDLFRLER